MSGELIPQEIIEEKIFIIRGKKVMLDWDLSSLYEVETRRLNEQVKRNLRRFPADFMFRLNKAEKDELVAKCDRFRKQKHSTAMPYAFTENGVAMLSSVLSSERAIDVNIQIMRAFTKMKKLLSMHVDIRRKLAELERKYDADFKTVFEAIRALMEQNDAAAGPKLIEGFRPGKK